MSTKYYSAKEAFSVPNSYMNGADIEANRKRPRGLETTIKKMEGHEFEADDGSVDAVRTLYHDADFDLSFRDNKTNGRALAESFGDEIMSWEGKVVAITARRLLKTMASSLSQ